MDWFDEGIILGARRHGETAAILEVLTRKHGRYLGLVHGGQSRRLKPILQTGNVLAVTWRARLSEQLGTFSPELKTSYAAIAMQDRMALAGLSTICGLARLPPERDPQSGLYLAMSVILEHLRFNEVWPGLLVRWELELLRDLGVGLDLSQCVSTGSQSDLIYVSPKSGCAVSRVAGEPFSDKLMKLPGFLRSDRQSNITNEDILQGLALTGYFLQTRVLEPRGLEMPEARTRLVIYISDNY